MYHCVVHQFSILRVLSQKPLSSFICNKLMCKSVIPEGALWPITIMNYALAILHYV